MNSLYKLFNLFKITNAYCNLDPLVPAIFPPSHMADESKQQYELHIKEAAKKWNTFVDDRKKKISDLILVPKNYIAMGGSSGVLKPDHSQEKLVTIKLSFGEFAVVKTSYFRRARISTYTDHWPVFAEIPFIQK